MDAHQNLAVRLGVAFYMYQKSLLDIAICQLMLDINKRERRKPRSCWAKNWIQQRPLHGHYDALIPFQYFEYFEYYFKASKNRSCYFGIFSQACIFLQKRRAFVDLRGMSSYISYKMS